MLEQLHAIHVGHDHVGKGDGKIAALQFLDSGQPIFRLVIFKAERLDIAAHKVQYGRIVINNEYLIGLHASCLVNLNSSLCFYHE
ncbi:MAG: hypothetical protein Q8O44_05765 [Syntrophales bacterium]|nr:hypothetical protein [Syntrophales bacterium]